MANSPSVHDTLNDSPQIRSGSQKSKATCVGADAEPLSSMPRIGGGWSSQPVSSRAQLGDSLADLRGLMYPSTNPFAYGNQPLAMLEDSQTITPEQLASFAGPASVFEVPASDSGAQDMAFGSFQNPVFTNPPQQGMYQTYGQGSGLSSPSSNRPNFPITESAGPPRLNHLNMDEAFWQQIDKGRTGLTSGVNLDELFGSDSGWSPMYMDQGYGRPGQGGG
jgi:hypothetical protein